MFENEKNKKIFDCNPEITIIYQNRIYAKRSLNNWINFERLWLHRSHSLGLTVSQTVQILIYSVDWSAKMRPATIPIYCISEKIVSLFKIFKTSSFIEDVVIVLLTQERSYMSIRFSLYFKHRSLQRALLFALIFRSLADFL